MVKYCVPDSTSVTEHLLHLELHDSTNVVSNMAVGNTILRVVILASVITFSLAVVNFKDAVRYPKSEFPGKSWAIIVGGRGGWHNYRYQVRSRMDLSHVMTSSGRNCLTMG